MPKERRHDAGDNPGHTHDPASNAPARRDWTKLPQDLAAEIAGRLLAVDLTEYIRFRAACKPWRQSTDDPRALHSRFLPRNWVVLPNHAAGEGTRRRLLNVATGASIAGVDLPELSGGHHPLGCAEGLVVLWNTAASAVRLVNPLTRAVTDLPDFSPLFADAPKAVLDSTHQFRGFGVVDGGAAPAPATATVVLCLDGEVPMVACVRPGEPRWALADTSSLAAKASLRSVLSLRGRVDVSTSTGDVLAVELRPAPRLVYVIRQAATATATATATVPPPPAPMRSFFLAPSGDDAGVILVRATRDRREVEVFEVDVDGRRLIPTTTVGADRAVFIGSARALSVSTPLFPCIAANAVYFCTGHGSTGLLFYVFHVDEGRGEAAFSGQEAGPFLAPCNLDVYLACCVDLVHAFM
ncbi:hypothetical protein ACP4OV_006125 [Aristida adscensionis]